MKANSLTLGDFLRQEVGLLILAILAAGVFAVADGIAVALRALAVFFLVPQPFLFYSFRMVLWDRIRRRR